MICRRLFLTVSLSAFLLMEQAHTEPLKPDHTVLEMKSASEWKKAANKLFAIITAESEKNRLTVAVPKAGEKAWDVCLHSPPLAAEIKKGEKIWLSFSLANAGPASPQPRIAAFLEPIEGSGVKFQLGSAAYAQEINVQETWTAEEDFPANSLRLSLHVAQQAQTVSLGPLQVQAYPATTLATELPTTPLSYTGRELDAPWRKAADARIREHRMSPVEVQVLTLAGDPVADASISWDQQRNAFGFGSYCESTLLKTDTDGENYRKYFLDNFNYATVSGYLAEWGWLKPENRQTSLEIADWLKAHQISARGHLLVYPGYVATPASWREIPPAERRQRLEAHFPAILNGLGERGVQEFDAVNELRDNIGFCDELGKPTQQTGLEVVTDWFKAARKLAPQAELFINEYWILAGGGYTQKEQDLYETTIQKLLQQGAPIDGIGLQGHFGSALTPPDRLVEILDRFAKLGKKIRITEFDIDIGDEQAQADYTRDFYTTLYSHPAVSGIVQWGFWEGQQWKPRGAMLRKDWTPKPNFLAFHKLTKETLASHFQAQTSPDGLWKERVHHGTHHLTVKVGTYTYQADINVDRKPTKVTVRVP